MIILLKNIFNWNNNLSLIFIYEYYYSTEYLDGTPGRQFDDPCLLDTKDLNLIDIDLVLNNPLIPVRKGKCIYVDGKPLKYPRIEYRSIKDTNLSIYQMWPKIMGP